MGDGFVDLVNRGLGLVPPGDDPVLKMYEGCCNGETCGHSHNIDIPIWRHRRGGDVGLKVESPSALELWLASKEHRWEEMRDIQRYFYESLENEVWKYEADVLRLFRLPSLEEVKRDAAGQDIGVRDREFEMPSAAQWVSYERIIREWQKALVGTDRLLTRGKKSPVGSPQFSVGSLQSSVGSPQSSVGSPQSSVSSLLVTMDKVRGYQRTMEGGREIGDDGEMDRWMVMYGGQKQAIAGALAMPVYQNFMLQAFSVGIKKTLQMIRQALRDYYKEMGLSDEAAEEKMREIMKHEVFPQLKNQYLAALIKEGGNRIRTHLYGATLQQVRTAIADMVRNKKGILDIARYLHRNFGGQLWYWLRIARTEPVLAYVSAFHQQAEVAKVQYVEWSALSTACAICAAFNGRVWKFKESPQPCLLGYSPIMTVEGWKQIKDIKVNDLVLTHKGRFRKVTKTYKRVAKNQLMIGIYYKNFPYAKGRKGDRIIGLKECITDNHPLMINGEWRNAGDIKIGDKVRLLAARCPICNKLQPYSRWRNAKGEQSNFCSLDCSNHVMDNWKSAPKQTERLLRNHDNKYEFIDVEVIMVKREVRKTVIVYNLEVDQDNSYIAKGFIVHNCIDTHPHCLCILVPLYMHDPNTPLQLRWDRESPYDRYYKPEEVAELPARLRRDIYPYPGMISSELPIQWKPVMTENDAQIFIRNSVEKRTFYHGTKHGDAIRKEGFKISTNGGYGPGVYTTNMSSEATVWGAESVPLKINLKNPYRGTQYEIDRFVTKYRPMGQGVLPQDAMRMMIKDGYDGLHVTDVGLGEEWYVVFDPKNIIVLEGK